MACQNHCSEFQITKFFQVVAVDKDIECTEVTTNVYDGYKFDLEGTASRFIKFQVRISIREILTSNYHMIQMYFNCWTLCQKANFSDKRKNLCLRMRLTGKNATRKLITKNINVQQSPGRAAGVVFPKSRPVLYQ